MGNSLPDDRRFGTVRLGNVHEETADDATITFTPHIWTPADGLRNQLPRDFLLELTAISDRNGLRRFLPACSWMEFIIAASLGGHAILSESGLLTAEAAFRSHLMRLVIQKTTLTQELLDRTFRRERDLNVSKPERGASDDRDILPDHLVLGANRRCTVAEFIAVGRSAATAAGFPVPTDEQCIFYGLREAARCNPINLARLSAKEALKTVRNALFNDGPVSEPIDPAIQDRVIERLLAGIEQHLDDTTAKFNRWFFRKAAGIIRRIEKQKSGGGAIQREVVRQVILDTIFRSFHDVGVCVHVQMQAIANAIPQPLIDEERAMFDALYGRQTCLGHLPLILVAAVSDVARRMVPEILSDSQNATTWGVLLRMLQFHGEMVRKKRSRQRDYKRQRSQGRNHYMTSDQDACLNVAAPATAPEASASSDLQDVAAELRRERRAFCRCGPAAGWVATLNVERSRDEGTLAFEDRCPLCGHTESVSISQDTARQILDRLRE